MVKNTSLSSIRFCVIVVAVLLCCCCCSCPLPVAAKLPYKPTVWAYLPEYRDTPNVNYESAFANGLTHLIFFSFEVRADGNLAALDRMPSLATAKKAREAADRHGGEVVLGFGGNSRSHGFGEMLLSPPARERFMEQLEALLVKYNISTWDCNYEYPTSVEQWVAWRDLMKLMKQRMLGGGGKLTISFTIYLDPNHFMLISRYDMLADDVADYCLCMVYDQPRKHATVAFFDSVWPYLDKYKNLPMHKFVTSVPFYSRDVRNGEPKTYRELVPVIEKRYQKKLAEAAAGAGNNQDTVVISPFTGDVAHREKFDMATKHHYYNSRSTIAWKAREAFRRGAGLMIWELEQDLHDHGDPRSLMTAIGHEVKNWETSQAGRNIDL